MAEKLLNMQKKLTNAEGKAIVLTRMRLLLMTGRLTVQTGTTAFSSNQPGAHLAMTNGSEIATDPTTPRLARSEYSPTRLSHICSRPNT